MVKLDFLTFEVAKLDFFDLSCVKAGKEAKRASGRIAVLQNYTFGEFIGKLCAANLRVGSGVGFEREWVWEEEPTSSAVCA